MDTLFMVVVVMVGYVIAYHTYGRFLACRIFQTDASAPVPSVTQRDDVDFVPTRRPVLFGHHFTSIAGLGPIVGPAIAIIWGWLPALLWVFFGAIFMGAVHDFGALLLSMRNRGRSIGDVAGDLVGPRVRLLFLVIIFFSLWIVVAIFALIIAVLFTKYPESVIPVWLEIPIALVLGYLVYKKDMRALPLGIVAVIVMYATVIFGAYCPVDLKEVFGIQNPLVAWMVILFVYVYIASTLPVQVLLQPRDYINSFQLWIAMLLLVIGVVVARPALVAPVLVAHPAGAPSMFPFLFITIACGAVSGFHSLVSSGTSSKQCASEGDCQFVGYGSMLMESALAVLVIVAVAAGLGMGLKIEGGGLLTGSAAFEHYYADWGALTKTLFSKIGAFIEGASNMLGAYGIPDDVAKTIMGVFLVSFAATTLDSATRIQRYVIGELATAVRLKSLAGRHPATLIAIITAFGLAFHNGLTGKAAGAGAMRLWPLFGCVNQLLAGLALLLLTVHLARKGVRLLYTAVPMVFMIGMTGWAMVTKVAVFCQNANWLLVAIGSVILLLEVWMIVECVQTLRSLRPAVEPSDGAT